MAERHSVKVRVVLATLLRIGWVEARRRGSHRVLERDGWTDFVFAFHALPLISFIALGVLPREARAQTEPEPVGEPATPSIPTPESAPEPDAPTRPSPDPASPVPEADTRTHSDVEANAEAVEASHDRRAAEPSAERYGLSPLISMGYADGLAGGAQWDQGIFALRISGGYLPLLLILADDDTEQFKRFELLHSGQINAEAMLFPIAAGHQTRVGLSSGYRYNTIMKHGVAFGVQVEGDLWTAVSLLATMNFGIFPRGSQLARDELGNPPDTRFNFPFGAGVQGGMGLGLKF